MSRFLFTSDVETEMNKWMDERDKLAGTKVILDDFNIPNNLEEAEDFLERVEVEYNEIKDSTKNAAKYNSCEYALALLDRIFELVEEKNDADIREHMERINEDIFDEE
jgi:hypothetical protein